MTLGFLSCYSFPSSFSFFSLSCDFIVTVLFERRNLSLPWPMWLAGISRKTRFIPGIDGIWLSGVREGVCDLVCVRMALELGGFGLYDGLWDYFIGLAWLC